MLEWLLNFDKAVFIQINSVWSNPWFDAFFPAITDLHKTWPFKFIFIPAVLLLMIWRKGLVRGAVIFIFCILSSVAADSVGNHLFKNQFQRVRPFNLETEHFPVVVRSQASGYSFVSNHASNNFAVAIFLSLFFPQVTALVYAVALLVSFSRIYNGVHFPSDVLAGAIIGTLCGWILFLLCKRIVMALETRNGVRR